MEQPIFTSINLAVLATLAVIQTLITYRVIRAMRTVLKANTDMLKVMNEMEDVMGKQQQALRQVRSAAIFWYVQWLQEVGKR